MEEAICTNTGGTDTSGAVLTANPGGAESLRSPTINYRPVAADHGPTDEAVSAPTV
jgi:hypothetical protein